MTRVLTQEMSMVVGVIAKFDTQNLHPRLAALDKATLSRVTRGDTISIGIAVPEGPLLHSLGRFCDDDPDGTLMFGTSANLTGQGQRFRVEDIEPLVVASVDLVINYGLQRWHKYGLEGVNFDAENMRVLRIGAGYEIFRDRILRWFPQLQGHTAWLSEDPDNQVGTVVGQVPDTA